METKIWQAMVVKLAFWRYQVSMRRNMVAALSLFMTIVALIAHAQEKAPVPSEEAQAEALELIKEVYGEEWKNAETPAQKQALATKLLEAAGESTGPANRYALLKVARDIAAQAGDAELAFRVIDATATRYDVDTYKLRGAALSQAAKSASWSAQSVAVAKLTLRMIDEAVDKDDFVAAKYLGGLALDAARSGRDGQLVKRIVARNKEVEGIAEAYAEIKDALLRLKDNPVDPEANLAVGRYHCFFTGNWDRGLSMLALGDDAALKDLAAKELADEPESLGLGDGWWELASTQSGVYRERALERAYAWYKTAAPKLSAGLARSKVDKRLESIRAELPDVETRVSSLNIGRGVSSSEQKEAREAIERGLDWLARSQRPDGGWTFATDPQRGTLTQCTPVATAMALLPLLRAGNTHRDGKFREAVSKGLGFLAAAAKVGRSGASFHQDGSTMYGHGIATWALCEAYRRSDDRKLRQPAQLAVNFIVFAQDPKGGGWRYKPRQAGDTSVTGWQVTALESAKDAGLLVPKQTFQRTWRFLDSVQAAGGIGYGYDKPGDPPACSAIGLLCRMVIGGNTHPGLKKGVARIAEMGPSSENCYFNFYATRLMRRQGGGAWEAWKPQIQRHLARSQLLQGDAAGSWRGTVKDHLTKSSGTLGITTVSLLTLQETVPE